MQEHLLFCKETKHLEFFLFHSNLICCEMNEFRSLNFPRRLSLSTSQPICSNLEGGWYIDLLRLQPPSPTLPQNHILSLLIAAAVTDASIRWQRGQRGSEAAMLLGNHLPRAPRSQALEPSVSHLSDKRVPHSWPEDQQCSMWTPPARQPRRYALGHLVVAFEKFGSFSYLCNWCCALHMWLQSPPCP